MGRNARIDRQLEQEPLPVVLALGSYAHAVSAGSHETLTEFAACLCGSTVANDAAEKLSFRLRRLWFCLGHVGSSFFLFFCARPDHPDSAQEM